MRGIISAAAAALTPRLLPGPIVLLYHRVTAGERDSFRLNVSPRHFAEQLDVLGRSAAIRRVSDIADTGRRAAGPARSVAVTFDDAYVDNLLHAKPLLERADVRATVFATGTFGQEFWWDALERILFGPAVLPPVLELDVDGRSYRWVLAELAMRRRRWLPIRVPVTGERPAVHGLLRRLHPLLKGLQVEERARALAALEQWAGPSGRKGSGYRSMTMAEVAQLAEGGIIEIGAHTVSHPQLALLTPAEQREEIRSGAARLQEILGAPVRGFAYPFGQGGDYNAASVQVLRELGFDYACSAFPGRVLRRTDRFQLPRFWVEDWNGDEFGRRLARWLSP